MTTQANDYVAYLNSLTPAQLEAERQRGKARLDAALYNRDFSEHAGSRADSVPTIKPVTHRDGTGRTITEYRGEQGSMRSWMGTWMTPPNLQLGIYNGSTPEQAKEFRRRMQDKMMAYERALAGGA
ncbi:hypothetical protein [Paraburkholderia sp. BCC1884]|uniref:hypothetical protein n=1 Tax=Paraburkholderia sp. BCC1884 TaxID=2562668 RepID=UPI001182250A|nr:hypothetical protein [Paraburkholderia sp. BCC1884]